MTRARVVPVALAAAVALAVVLLASLTGTATRFEQRTIDARFQLRGERPADGVAVIAIDTDTLTELGKQWPLPRGLHADTIDRLRRARVRQIVYDVQFSEPSGSPRQDLALFDAVARARGTVLASGESDERGQTLVLGGPENLARIGAFAGAANLPAEAGGVLRRYEPRVNHLPTMPAIVARELGRPVPAARFPGGSALIDFRGPAGTVPTYSFYDLLKDRVPASALRGRVVVVGATAPTLQDLHPSAAGGKRLMPGPEIQANAIWTALHGNPLQEAPGWVRYALLVLLGVCGPLLVLAVGPVRGTAAVLVVGGLYAGGAHLAFTRGLVLPVVVPMASLALAGAAAVLTSVAAEIAERRLVVRRNADLEAAVLERTRELERTHLDAVERLARAAEMRDDDTGEHLGRMSRLCERVALQLGQSPTDARLLRQAAILHDVGKIGLPDGILRKPGKLTPEEIEVMRLHTTQGAALLDGSRSPLLVLAEEIARTHHERWDGTGYPAGLSGDAIPLPGRIAAVSDVFDALVSDRPYKQGWTVEAACEEIAAQRGRHFDPVVADALLSVLGQDRPADPGWQADVRPERSPATATDTGTRASGAGATAAPVR